jgi:uncharacterized membrane protein (UPF0127 family)
LKESVCAFNITRQAFLSLGVAVADSPLARLRGLLGKMRLRSNEALWVAPSRGIHTIGLMFSIDVIYLDANLRVIDLVENLAPLRISRIRLHGASVLQLPARSISESGTKIGDQLLIGSAQEMEQYWAAQTPKQNTNVLQPEPEPRNELRPGAKRVT